MKYLHIDPSNKKDLEQFKKAVHSKTPIFALFYMEGCGPCNATRPEWSKLKNAKLNSANILIVDIDHTLLDDLKEFPKISNVSGFPNMKFIHGKDKIEEYNGGRTIDDFVRWINSKSPSIQKGGRKRKSRKNRKSRRKHTIKRIKAKKIYYF